MGGVGRNSHPDVHRAQEGHQPRCPESHAAVRLRCGAPHTSHIPSPPAVSHMPLIHNPSAPAVFHMLPLPTHAHRFAARHLVSELSELLIFTAIEAYRYEFREIALECQENAKFFIPRSFMLLHRRIQHQPGAGLLRLTPHVSQPFLHKQSRCMMQLDDNRQALHLLLLLLLLVEAFAWCHLPLVRLHLQFLWQQHVQPLISQID